MQPSLADFTASGQDGLVLAGWIWNFPAATRAEAEQAVEKLRQHDDFPTAKYIMLLSQEKAFVWRRDGVNHGNLDFADVLSVKDVFDHYFGPTDPDHRVQGANLLMAVENWLFNLSYSDFSWPIGQEARNALERIGLLKDLQDSTVFSTAT
jgi:hypothetical protein